MFERAMGVDDGAGEPVTLAVLRDLVADLAVTVAASSDSLCVDQLEALERVKAAAAAAQARIAAQLDASLVAQHEARRAVARAKGRVMGARRVTAEASIGAQVGLARRESPHRGRQLLGLARALVHDLPDTLAALERGDLNERRAQIIATESRDLSAADRRVLDAEIAERLRRSPSMGDRELQHAAQRAVMRIDQPGHLERRAKAHARRGVTCRRLADGMAMVTGVVSDLHAAAIMSSLNAATTRELQDPGTDDRPDDRTRTQVLADLFVSRLTGQSTAAAVAVHLNLVVSAETLLDGGDEPGDIVGHGPIPAGVARALAVASPAQRTRIRRLFAFREAEDADGRGGDRLVAMDSTSRTFDGLLREFIVMRDQLCRTPWCNNQIGHVDHVVPAAAGGPTDVLNGQGLCETCNYVKETPGWTHTVCTMKTLDRHLVAITTPTGHRHQSRAPSPPVPPDLSVPRDPPNPPHQPGGTC